MIGVLDLVFLLQETVDKWMTESKRAQRLALRAAICSSSSSAVRVQSSFQSVVFGVVFHNGRII